MRQMRIIGAKGDSGGGSASESPDTLHSDATAKILDILSEGPIVGLVNGLQSVFLDGTPIQNSDGSFNFSNYSVDGRWGTQDQTYLSGFPSVANETAVAVALTSDSPWVRQVTNTQLSAVVIRFGVPELEQTNKSTGDITGYRVEYAIDLATDGGSYSQVVSGAFDGKCTSLYERSIRIELPKADASWLVRVRRLTANAHSSYIADAINIEAITEVIDRKLSYPNTALIGMSFDAQSFSSVPTRGYLVRGRIVSVPSNYDPGTRTYTGVWDGTFKQAWTNNPAWVFYDLVLNTRYGGGRFIDASSIDRWTLYAIAQYCDEMVDNGQGGTEPRFTCNAVIQSQADAFKVLQDFAAIFRGQTYWGAGAVLVTADMPKDPVYVYNQTNVVGGKFTYGGTERKTRYTVAQVSYNDPNNQYKQAVEPVQDDDALARYGVIKASITAVGCTSQSEAHRRGLWIVESSWLETQTVQFSVGLDGTLSGPGDVVAIVDPKKAGRRIGGRIHGMTDRKTVVLDKAPTVKVGDQLTVIMPDGVAQKQTVDSVDGDTVAVVGDFDSLAVAGAVWMLESDDLVSQLFSVVSVEEQDENGQITYLINGIQHEPGKFAYIDNGVMIQRRPITVIPARSQVPPASVTITSHQVLDQGISRTTMTIGWSQADGAVTYGARWRKDGGNWVSAGSALSGLSVDIQGVYTGSYEAQVWATNALGVSSLATSSGVVALEGKTGAPPVVAALSASVDQVFQIELDWGFPADGTASDTAYTEIAYSRTTDVSTATTQGIYAYPTNKALLMGLAAGQSFFFWARLVDRSGNVGAWYPNGAGVQGMSTIEAAPVLAQLAGSLTESEFGEELLGKIQAIPQLQQSVTDAAETVAQIQQQIAQVQQTASGQQNAITDLQDSLSTLSGLDFAQLKTDLDELAGANLTDLLTDVGELKDRVFPEMAGDDGEFAGDEYVYAGAVTEQSMREEADLALSERVDGVAALLDTAQSNAQSWVTNEAQARSAADSALATSITDLGAQFTTAQAATAAEISAEQTARADGDSANAQAITNLSATVTQNQQATSAQITAEVQARADAVSAVSQSLSTLRSTVTNNQTAANAAIASESKTRADADTAATARMDSLQSSLNNNSAAITNLSQTTTTATAALAQEVAGINAVLDSVAMAGDSGEMAGDVSVLAGEVSSNSVEAAADMALAQKLDALQAQYRAGNNQAMTAVQTEVTNRTSAVESVAQSVTTLSATMTTADAQLAAQVSQEATARAGADLAMAQTVTTLQAAVTKGDQANAAAITQEATTRASADSALSDTLTMLAATVTKGDAINSALIQSEAQTRADADSANAQAITQLQATVNTTIAAEIQQEATVRASADMANAQAITALQTTVGQNSAAIQTNAQSYADLSGKVNASYTIKVQTSAGGVAYAAGMTLGANGQTSIIAFSANQFIVVDPNGGAVESPFAIINGQVFLNDAFIQHASITNAVVGSTLQSARTGSNGRPMVIVDFANGAFEINGVNGGGGWMTFNGQTLCAYDGNGVLRVRCGLW